MDLQAAMVALAKRYDIDLKEGPIAFYKLALNLAIVHGDISISGKRRAGAPMRWSLGPRTALLVRVERAAANGQRNLAAVVRHLTKKGEPYAGVKSLRRRIEEAQKDMEAARFAHLLLVSDAEDEVLTLLDCAK